jgi:class 3 adenylate cyclase/predicted ATPase
MPGTSSPASLPQSNLLPAPLGLGEAPLIAQRELEAERRHLTLLFCDLVDSTPLAAHLDLEELREVVRAYHTVCAEVIERFDGHIAQYLGDGLLVYFGYPQAHEDDAQRAVRTGLGIVEALGPLQRRVQQERRVSLAVRIGIHSGLVVVGEIGEGARHERLALGEAPNLAARLQGLAPSNTVLISGTTARLVQGWFICEALGDQTIKGFSKPMPVYRVLGESGVQSRLDTVSAGGLTPLVGREREVDLLVKCWEDAKQGLGQVVVLSGEAGIGKSRLVQAVKDRLANEPYTRLECRCSPYAQHSALYPVIDFGRRLLQWQRDEPPDVTLDKLEAALAPYEVSLPEVVPLLASLLSLPLSERYALPQLTPQRQKQKTLEAILALVLAHATQQPVLFIVEDLHWIDPSTLELLTLFIDQGPTARILTVLTARPEFHPPWGTAANVTSLTLGRLPPTQVEQMIDQVTGGKRLPAAVRQEVVAKTDGVPLFVEELTKMVLESGLLQEEADHYELRGSLPSLAIPTTLHDSLMARLDRLGNAKEVTQLGATLGRTFSYELLRAVSPWGEESLRDALRQLVDVELLYQRGVPPHLTYIFKHALIQEAAYQSLLKSKRQQYHQQTVHILEQRFPEIAETQPELLAHHYTEAGLPAQALPYWQQAGQLAVERSANIEAISHFTKGLELLKSLPATPERTRQELALQLALGPPLRMIKGHTAPEVEGVYTRAYGLSQQVGNHRQQFSSLVSLSKLYFNRAMIQKARELCEQCLTLAQRVQDPVFLLEAHEMFGTISLYLGEPVVARMHLEQGIALYNAQQGRLKAFSSGMDPGVVCLSAVSWALWILGYPDRALTKSCEALTLAQELSHAYSLGYALNYASLLHVWRREVRFAKERAEAVITLSNEHGFIQALSAGMIKRGWALAKQGAVAEGIRQLHQGLATIRDMGLELPLSLYLALLADAYRQGGQVDAGLHVLAEALTHLDKTWECGLEAEIYRLKGACLLAQTDKRCQEREAEECFRQALEVARHQQAKSLELRAAMSLCRLWQQHGRRAEAHQILAEIYSWFTEGFETPDLQEAKALLEALQ